MLHGTDVKKWFLILVLIIQYCITVLATFLGYINGNEYLIYTRRGGGTLKITQRTTMHITSMNNFSVI